MQSSFQKNNPCNTEEEFEKNGQRLLSLIYSRVQNEDESKDILQDTFLKFEECRQKDCQCDHPRAYLFQMALNAVADFFKHKKKERSLVEQIDPKIESAGTMEGFPCDPFDCTYQFLGKLSKENQLAFIKSDIEHIPQTELAKEWGIPLSTLKSRVQRTRSYLKREFEACLKNY